MKVYTKILFFIFFLASCQNFDNQIDDAPAMPDSTTYLLKSYVFDDYNASEIENYGDNWTNAAKKIFYWQNLIETQIKLNYEILAHLQSKNFYSAVLCK